MTTNILRALTSSKLLAISSITIFGLAFSGCGASGSATVRSDGTVSARVDVPVPSATVTVGAGAGASVTYADAQPGCAEQWVHMPMLINFPSGGAIIDEQNRQVLHELVLSAQGRTDIQAVRVEGHTDTCGREVNNMALSAQRAETVAMELVQMGVPRERLQTIGYGSEQPRANESCERQAQDDLSRNTNRRVEFSLLICR